MAYWLVKSEPEDWSFDQQCRVPFEPWTGVRNAQAQKNMAAMQEGDIVFFYHSGKSREIVGLCTVARSAYADPSDAKGKAVLVDLKALERAKTPLSLTDIKAQPAFAHLALVRQARLSVMPIDDNSASSLLSQLGLSAHAR